MLVCVSHFSQKRRMFIKIGNSIQLNVVTDRVESPTHHTTIFPIQSHCTIHLESYMGQSITALGKPFNDVCNMSRYRKFTSG